MNRVEWELYGETNVDQVTDKTNKGLDGIEKNSKRVSDAFTMSLSSIFLKFLGPMALLQAAMNWIGGKLDEAKSKAEEAQAFAEKGESKYLKSSTAYLARKASEEASDKKEQEMANEANAQYTEKYLREGNNEFKVMNKLGVKGWLKYGLSTYGFASKQDDVQKAVEELLKDEMGNERLKSIKGDFKGVEGFGSVVGVGANPILDAITEQRDIQREMLRQLEIANQHKGGTDFTKVGEPKGFRATPYGL